MYIRRTFFVLTTFHFHRTAAACTICILWRIYAWLNFIIIDHPHSPVSTNREHTFELVLPKKCKRKTTETLRESFTFSFTNYLSTAFARAARLSNMIWNFKQSQLCLRILSKSVWIVRIYCRTLCDMCVYVRTFRFKSQTVAPADQM